ncbi:MAG: hypothetical protein QXO74_07000, partial [Candidatus Methanomethylicia archaeon]
MSFCMLPHIFRLKFFTLILIISVCTLWFGCSNYSNHIHQFNGFAYGQIADYSVVLFNVTLYIREDNTVSSNLTIGVKSIKGSEHWLFLYGGYPLVLTPMKPEFPEEPAALAVYGF